MPRSKSEAIERAKTILAGQDAAPQEVLGLVKTKLKKERAFGLARKLLDHYASDQRVTADARVRLEVAQQRALCTYKDADLPAEEKLETALRILREDADLDRSLDRETLGLAGAIFKRRWELTSQERDLEVSLAYYERGYTDGTTEDYGYTGINAAFVLDLLAAQESVAVGISVKTADASNARRELARKIRRELVARLPSLPDDKGNEWLNKEWWFLVTLGEAYFGLDECDAARLWLQKAKALPDVPDWEVESTARQLATLLLLKRRSGIGDTDKAEKVLREFLGSDNALTSVIRGKIGVALSGGGFRASLFHIGVLAKLAELDLLRSVEFLSCVSGGSIIGAYYYLEVRHLLRTKTDAEITRQDYIDIVKRIERDFLEGVQQNIRTRILAEWTASLKMIFVPEYSRTKRAGELYESEIYSRVQDGENMTTRWFNALTLVPKGEPQNFAPKDHNWRRGNKVPILILNATTLNTGHNWQFTATWMGEPPGTLDTKVDANYRLRRLYYDEAPFGNTPIRLGDAVAASACVPGIFEPLSLTRLYERDTDRGKIEPIVRLVDGGVQDNQGISALLDQGCNVLLVSDASGQMSADDFPGTGLLNVPLRANSILQARVREAQYREISARRRSGLLKGMMFIHLKQDLEIDLVDWIDCQDPSRRKQARPLTSYGVQRKIQQSITALRTDLDSFSDAEGYALMCDGYLMTEHALKSAALPLGFALNASAREQWKFLEVEELMRQPPEGNPLLRQLEEGDKLFFKIWALSSRLRGIGALVAIGLVCALGSLIYWSWTKELFVLSVGKLVLLLGATLLSLFGLGWVSKVANYRKTLDQILIGIGLAGLGAFLAKLHLHIFDQLFLKQGKVEPLIRGTEAKR
ncbi:MAG: patatin family protein [Deltaproteobacteria bacterium]|nr:patatin family protein [Deltaproteobacteria bacterium]